MFSNVNEKKEKHQRMLFSCFEKKKTTAVERRIEAVSEKRRSADSTTVTVP